jgi:hypothetical protein
MVGYILPFLKKIDRPISEELLIFYRGEQMKRLKNIAFKAVMLRD